MTYRSGLRRMLLDMHIPDWDAALLRDYDPAELVLTCGAGTPLAELEALVAAKGQMLAFEPHGAPGSTIGGVVAAGVSGSRRVSRGAPEPTAGANRSSARPSTRG